MTERESELRVDPDVALAWIDLMILYADKHGGQITSEELRELGLHIIGAKISQEVLDGSEEGSRPTDP